MVNAVLAPLVKNAHILVPPQQALILRQIARLVIFKTEMTLANSRFVSNVHQAIRAQIQLKLLYPVHLVTIRLGPQLTLEHVSNVQQEKRALSLMQTLTPVQLAILQLLDKLPARSKTR